MGGCSVDRSIKKNHQGKSYAENPKKGVIYNGVTVEPVGDTTGGAELQTIEARGVDGTHGGDIETDGTPERSGGGGYCADCGGD